MSMSCSKKNPDLKKYYHAVTEPLPPQKGASWEEMVEQFKRVNAHYTPGPNAIRKMERLRKKQSVNQEEGDKTESDDKT